MPQLGETVADGTVTKWFKSEGDTVTRGETLFEVSTDKVDTEIPSPADGVLTKILVAEGETVDVGTLLAVIGYDDLPEASPSDAPATSTTSSTSVTPERTKAPATASSESRAHVSPVVRRLLAEHQLDAGFYDLLASEARATSLWAIAKGDVPAAHWAALGRPFFAVGDLAGLRSWSGSMFEYLMPTLVLDEPHGSVLNSAAKAAVIEQIAFARRHHVP